MLLGEEARPYLFRRNQGYTSFMAAPITSEMGRLVGILGAVGTVVFWGYFVSYNPYAAEAIIGAASAMAAAMTALAVVGGGSAWKKKPSFLFMVFVVSFLPVGFYMLGTPGLFKLIGLFNGLFLVSGFLMLVGRNAVRS